MNNAIKIENLIKTIGRANITIDKDSRDYLINNESPNSFPQDYFLKLYEEFKRLIYLQLSENCSHELLEKLIEETNDVIDTLSNLINHRRVNYVLDKSKNLISDEAEDTDEYLTKMLKIKVRTLELIKIILENELKYFGLHTSQDYIASKENIETGNDVLISEKTQRATFSLGKKESLMFLYILEQEEILKFNDESHRKQFIENNFNFTEIRNNPDKGNTFPMKGIGSEFSDFKSYAEADTNNKTLEKLLKKLQDTIHQYEFNNKKNKK